MTQLDYVQPVYYRHSGRTPIVRLLVALVTILPVVALAGAVYAIIDIYLPMLRFAKLVLVLAMGLMAGFAFGVGALTGKMLMWARVRNLAMVWVVAALAALVAWYVAWVTWEWHLFTQYEPQIPKARFLLALLIRPRGVWLLATEINRVGTFGIGSGDDLIRGPFLWVLWAIEAAVVLGAATWVPVRMVRGRAFCERCQKWGRIRQGVLSVGPTADEDRLRARLALKDLSALEELGPADISAPRRLRVDLQNCPSCDTMHLLSVYRVDVTYPKGQRTEKVKNLIDRLWLAPEQAKEIEEMKERVYGGGGGAGTTPAVDDGSKAEVGGTEAVGPDEHTIEGEPGLPEARPPDQRMGL